MGKRRKYTDEQLKEAVATSSTMAETLRKLNMALVGGNATFFRLRCKRIGIDTSHFKGRGWAKGIPNDRSKKSADEILVEGRKNDYRTQASRLRRALLEKGTVYACSRCQITNWEGVDLVLEVDHINGIYWDNRESNLQFLCPNCHSLKTKGH